MKKTKAKITKHTYPVGGDRNYYYNVALWFQVVPGERFYYTGIGKYFRTEEEAEKYAAENADAGIEKNY